MVERRFVTRSLGRKKPVDHVDAKEQRCARSNRDEAVHVGRAVDERPEAAREVAAVGQREQELREGHHRSALRPREHDGHGQARHRPHRKPHEGCEQRKGPDETHAHGFGRRLRVRLGRRRGRSPPSPRKALLARPVARIFHRTLDVLDAEHAFVKRRLERIREQVHLGRTHAAKGAHGLLHAARAGRAAHARHVELSGFHRSE